MKSLFIALTIMATFSTNSQASDVHQNKASFYECSNIADVEEYRVGIDLKKDLAGFFDNDTTSMMKQVRIISLESNPPQTLITFEGKDATYDSLLRLDFNLTKKTIVLYSVNNDQVEIIGKADCELAPAWDF